jgi:hypothetical protein
MVYRYLKVFLSLYNPVCSGTLCSWEIIQSEFLSFFELPMARKRQLLISAKSSSSADARPLARWCYKRRL